MAGKILELNGLSIAMFDYRGLLWMIFGMSFGMILGIILWDGDVLWDSLFDDFLDDCADDLLDMCFGRYVTLDDFVDVFLVIIIIITV